MRVGKTLTEEELEDHVLYEADPVKVGELSAWRKCTILVLARYPLLHSVFWLSVVGWAALRATDDKQALLKAVIECWLVYSFGKYVVTGTCGFRGLRLLRGNDAATGKVLSASLYQKIVDRFHAVFGAEGAGWAFMTLFVAELSDFRRPARHPSPAHARHPAPPH